MKMQHTTESSLVAAESSIKNGWRAPALPCVKFRTGSFFLEEFSRPVGLINRESEKM